MKKLGNFSSAIFYFCITLFASETSKLFCITRNVNKRNFNWSCSRNNMPQWWIAVTEDQGTKDFVAWQNSVGFLAASKMFLTASLKFGESWENFDRWIKIIHGCALRKIVRSPMLSACEIQGIQQMISVKNLNFSSFDRLQKLPTRATAHASAQSLDTRNAWLPVDRFFCKTNKILHSANKA